MTTIPLARSRASGFKLLTVHFPGSGNESQAGILKSIFASVGSISTDNTIEQAIQLMPDAIVLECSSKDKALIELIYSLKRNLLTCHIPLVVFGSNCTSEFRLQSLEAGVDAIISSPTSLKLIKFQIENLILNRKLLKSYYTKDASFIECLPSDSFEEQFISRVERLMEANYNDVNYNVTQLAKELAVSRTNLYTKIKSLTGRTTSEYLRIFRLKKGAELLKQGNLNVSEVTFRVGLKDPKYFSKTFKNLFGITPTEFMRGNPTPKSCLSTANSSVNSCICQQTPA